MTYFRLPSKLFFSYVFNLFILVFFVLIVKFFCNSGHHSQIISWRITWHLGLLRIKALGTDGGNYGTCEEGSLFKFLQTLVNMWSFSRCKCFKEDIGSLWYEFGVRNVDRKALDVCLFLHLGQEEVVMAQDVEWVCCFMEGQKIPQAQVF